MKKLIIVILLTFLTLPVFSDSDNLFQIRTGVLVKIDPGLTPNYAPDDGPTPEEIPEEMPEDQFEEMFLNKITGQSDKAFVLSIYENRDGRYILRNDIILSSIDASLIKERVIGDIKRRDKAILFDNYQLNRTSMTYNITDETKTEEISRDVAKFIFWNIMLEYNTDNEIPTGLDISGMPMPHGFPRVFEPRTKANFDLCIGWGNVYDNDITLRFSINLTNFVMPSFEIAVKYNFETDNDTLSPFIGGALYGGVLDGFPIGINAIGGIDFYPIEPNENNREFFYSLESRFGGVLYTSTYFDKGQKAGGIWKDTAWLLEGGLYFNTGYIKHE
jgi:hypothetical protein